MCLESGTYLMNYAGCSECNKKQPIKISNKTQQEEEEEETITYQRTIIRKISKQY